MALWFHTRYLNINGTGIVVSYKITIDGIGIVVSYKTTKYQWYMHRGLHTR